MVLPLGLVTTTNITNHRSTSWSYKDVTWIKNQLFWWLSRWPKKLRDDGANLSFTNLMTDTTSAPRILLEKQLFHHPEPGRHTPDQLSGQPSGCTLPKKTLPKIRAFGHSPQMAMPFFQCCLQLCWTSLPTSSTTLRVSSCQASLAKLSTLSMSNLGLLGHWIDCTPSCSTTNDFFRKWTPLSDHSESDVSMGYKRP